jgi:hypothetical protein
MGQGPLSPITARKQDARTRANSVGWRKAETSKRSGAVHSPSLSGPMGCSNKPTKRLKARTIFQLVGILRVDTALPNDLVHLAYYKRVTD